ncbi:conserved hypothetical protein [Luminiphilus syltensis NOR5-1B]|uniref:DUF560 domain-containing protein n=1 Tax=Luminiphilus syltensis NOR5-1B TaxID=565045 RepID=B8KXB8_9GAMM|nr:surface lipoprotein assembly modifier [Luminiphilus syltensis]EED36310.1 conserved hypothetical protein [Luminiphilus syltensis NOR5-1B]
MNQCPAPYFQRLLGISVCCALSFGEVHAETTLSGGVNVGREYDSNVSIDEVEASSGRSDHALVYGADIGVDQTLGDNAKASLSYSFGQTAYDTYSRLSRQTHILGANLSANIGAISTGLNYFYINALLDGNDFLTYKRLSPSISGFASKRWFFRGAYVRSEKSIETRSGRDAITDGAELDAYFFWKGLRRYINAGYNYKSENSQADRFDYRSHGLKLRFVQRFTAFERLSTVELSARFEQRDYSADTPSIGEERDDDRLRLKAELEIPVTSYLNWQVYGAYGDYSSNLPAADYDQTVVGTRVEIRF